jgi:uncharacterized damage-inducible protein DinB
MDLRYPIGKFTYDEQEVLTNRTKFINEIASLPNKLEEVTATLTEEQLTTPYREGGWNIKQVIHHLADSHMNSFIRFKLALTEDEPLIKTYDEDKWAHLEDSNIAIQLSIDLLKNLHQRWVILLKSMSETDYQRTFKHPQIGLVSLNKNLSLYAWHGNHHLQHIVGLSQRMGWK